MDELGLRYTRRRDRWLAYLWPPKRRQLRRMQALLNFSAQQNQDAINRAIVETISYGERWPNAEQ